METERCIPTSEQVSQFLIGNGLYLTGLEFLAEGQELGGFELSFLQNFFSDTARFPPEEVQRFQGEDVLSSILLAKEREQRLCLAEYELRVATEDLKKTKDWRDPNREASLGHLIEDAPISKIASGADHFDSIDAAERKHLNSVVMAYLMHAGYKVTALTFQEEAFPDFMKVHPPGDTLSAYYHTTQETSRTGQGTEPEQVSGGNCSAVQLEDDSFCEPDTPFARAELVAAQNREQDATPTANQLKRYDPASFDTDSVKEAALNGSATDCGGDSDSVTTWKSSPAPKIATYTPSSDLLSILIQYLPKIIPNVLIKKRSDCIPVLSTLVRDHPDVSCRQAVLEMLFGLIKHPDDEQRHDIVAGIGILAEIIGSQRITQEIIPHCCELANHKRHEKRLLVAEVIGVISQHVEDDIRSSLLLSVLQQLSEDADASVRNAALRSLISCIETANVPSQKQRTVEGMLIGFITDSETCISDTALSGLAPLLSGSKCGLQLTLGFIQQLCEGISNVLMSCPPMSKNERVPNGDAANSVRFPRSQQQKSIMALLDLYSELLPEVAKLCADQLPFWVVHNLRKSESEDPLTEAADKERNSLDTENSERTAIAFEQWLDEEDEEGGDVRVFIRDIIPSLIASIGRIAPVNECFKLREQFASIIRSTCRAFEWCVAEGAIKPLFLSASGLRDVYLPNKLTRSKYLLEVMLQRQPREEDAACVFPICMSAIISEGGETAFCNFVTSLLTPASPSRAAWASQNEKEFTAAAVFSGGIGNVHDMLAVCMRNYATAPDVFLRNGAAMIAEALSIHASYPDALTNITPIVLELATDPELVVRLGAVSALKQLCVIHATSIEMQTQIYDAVENIMTSDVPQVRLAALGAFSAASSECSVHAVFVLRQLPAFLEELRTAPASSNPFHLQITATAVFDALLVLEGVEVLDTSLRGHLIAHSESLMQCASSYLDNAQRQILAAMVSDQTSKMATPKRRLLSFSKTPKKASMSADLSFLSDSSHAGN